MIVKVAATLSQTVVVAGVGDALVLVNTSTSRTQHSKDPRAYVEITVEVAVAVDVSVVLTSGAMNVSLVALERKRHRILLRSEGGVTSSGLPVLVTTLVPVT